MNVVGEQRSDDDIRADVCLVNWAASGIGLTEAQRAAYVRLVDDCGPLLARAVQAEARVAELERQLAERSVTS